MASALHTALSKILDKLGIVEMRNYQVEALSYIQSSHQSFGGGGCFSDLLVVLPTGYGKSLLYQVAPFLNENEGNSMLKSFLEVL